VLEEVTAPAESTLPKPDEPFWTSLMREPCTPPRWDGDYRDATLEVDRGSMKVHHVTWVDVNTWTFQSGIIARLNGKHRHARRAA